MEGEPGCHRVDSGPRRDAGRPPAEPPAAEPSPPQRSAPNGPAPDEPRPAPAEAAPGTPSARRVAALVGTLVALTVIGSSAVAVALPELRADLSLDTAGTAWVLATFGATFSVSTAVFGRLGDLWGLRAALVAGLTLFTAGSLLAGAAWSFPALIAGRLLQGAGAGAVPVLSLGIVTARFSGAARSRAFGSFTAVVSLVSASGPLIGGGLTAIAGWRAVLALPATAAVLGIPVARLAPRHAPGMPAPGPDGAPDAPRATWRSVTAVVQRFDVVGAAAVAATIGGIVLLLQAPATGLGRPAIAILAVIAVVAAAGVVWRVRARPHGFLPAAVVGRARFRRAAAAGLTLLAAYIGALFTLPLLLSAERGWSPLAIGVALVPAAAVGAVASQVVGRLVARVRHFPLVAGLAACSVAGLLLAAASQPPPLLVAGMALVVIGFAGGQVALVDGIAAGAEDSVRGAALGVFNMVFFVGSAVGAATIGGLSGVTSLRGALALLAILPALGVLAAVTARR